MYSRYLLRKLRFLAALRLNCAQSTGKLAGKTNTLLVSVRHELAETQLYPFHYYRRQLASRFNVRAEVLPIRLLSAEIAKRGVGSPGDGNPHIEWVFYQHGFMMPDAEVVQHLDYLRQRFPRARICFLDWFAPLHIRYSTSIDPYVDVYVKKQTYRDFSAFSRPTLGDTNLNDYYARRFAIPDSPQQHTPPAGFAEKMRIGTNFYLSPQMVDLFLGAPPSPRGRDIDLHARIAINGTPWYRAMRQEAKDAVERLQGLNIASAGRVRRPQFFREMARSKVCFSPFGYGEICWRDYEAFATGATLIKPDISHLTVEPDIFVPDETYLPVRWDLEDFETKLQALLGDADKRHALASRAFARIREHLEGSAIPDAIGALYCQ